MAPRPTSSELVTVAEADGQLEAEILRSFLVANGVQVWLSGESAGSAIGLNIGPLARIELLVQADQAEQARRLMAEADDSDERNAG